MSRIGNKPINVPEGVEDYNRDGVLSWKALQKPMNHSTND